VRAPRGARGAQKSGNNYCHGDIHGFLTDSNFFYLFFVRILHTHSLPYVPLLLTRASLPKLNYQHTAFNDSFFFLN
jgi:hypothetical protein